MIIEKADKKDLSQILELQYLAYQSEAKLLNDFSIQPLKQSLSEVEQEYDNGIFLKATDETGRLLASVRAHINQNTAYIGKLIVHPDKQGQGIGTQMLLSVEGYCPAKRYELFTSNKSIRNIKLYERLGYVRFKEQNINSDLCFIYLEKCLAEASSISISNI